MSLMASYMKSKWKNAQDEWIWSFLKPSLFFAVKLAKFNFQLDPSADAEVVHNQAFKWG